MAPYSEDVDDDSLWKRIAEATSPEVADKIFDLFGGLPIEIREKPKPSHVLSRTIGVENVEAIVREIGWGEILIPVGPKRGWQGQRKRIVEFLEQGTSLRDTAWVLGISQRCVEKVRAQLKKHGTVRGVS